MKKEYDGTTEMKSAFELDEDFKRNHEQLKKYKELSDKGELGVYIMTKGKPLNKWEQMIRRILPNSLYAESLWYKATGSILGTTDEDGKMKPFKINI